jgi:trans-aconitate methyltransferase
VLAGHGVLVVGSGPGALTAERVSRLGVSAVAAVDPSAMFIEALRERLPGVAAQRSCAEALSFAERRLRRHAGAAGGASSWPTPSPGSAEWPG